MLGDDYVMGFVEGEGCFSIAIQKDIDRKERKTGRKFNRKRPSLGLKVCPTFKVVAVEDERAVLEELVEHFGFGKIYVQQRAAGGFLKPAAHYCVQSFAECEKIETYFKDKKFHTSKGKSFQLWSQCLEIMRQKQHKTKEGLLKICELRDQMNHRLGGKHSRTKEVIQKILDQMPEHIEVHANNIHNQFLAENPSWYLRAQGKHKQPPNSAISEVLDAKTP